MTQTVSVAPQFKKPPWRFFDGVLVMIAAFGAYTAFSLIHMQLVAHTVGMEAYLGDGDRLPPGVLLMGQLSKALALMGALWLVGIYLKRVGWAEVGLRKVNWRWIAVGALFGAAFFVTGLFLIKSLVGMLPGWTAMTTPNFTFENTSNLATVALYLLLTFAITPFAEEVFFRGFMFRWMSGHHPVWLAAIISSIIFGVSHILPPQVINACVMSLALCWLYWRTGSIWPSIVAHAVNNIIGVLMGAAAAAGALPAFFNLPA